MARVRISRTEKVRTAKALTTPLVARTTSQISHFARTMVPRGSHLSGSGRRRAGKTLSSSMYSQLRVGDFEILGRVGSRKRYATTIHQGSRPHVIRSRGKMLKFQWERGNLLLERRGRGRRQFFFFNSVRHPGNKRPVRYLTTPLSMVARRNGFLVFGVGRGRRRLP